MALLFGTLLAVVGAGLFLLSAVLVSKANAGMRLPLFRNAVVLPRSALILRATGAAVIVVGSALVGRGIWVIAVVLLAMLPGLLTLMAHNLRLARPGR